MASFEFEKGAIYFFLQKNSGWADICHETGCNQTSNNCELHIILVVQDNNLLSLTELGKKCPFRNFFCKKHFDEAISRGKTYAKIIDWRE